MQPVVPARGLPSVVAPNRSQLGLGLMEYAGKYSVSRPSNETYQVYLENLVEAVSWLLAHEYDVRLLIGDLEDIHVTKEFRGLLRERLFCV
jgi:hypothetical protein